MKDYNELIPDIYQSEIANERLDDCEICEYLDVKHERCMLCNCPVYSKAMDMNQECPDGRWSKII